MPADNLNFIAKWDVDSFKRKCREQRELAEKWPAYDPWMAMVEEYQWMMGPWHLTFCLETWSKPRWHGSAAVVEQIGYQTIREGIYNKAEIPQDALLSIDSWEPEHHEQARFILAEVFGPILKPGDNHQRAVEHKGLWGLHWLIQHDGPKLWLKNLH